MEPEAAFAKLMAGPLRNVALDRACLLLATVLDPDPVDVERELGRLDDLAAGITEPTLDAVRRHLFAREGFTGDREGYYEPANSLLPSVLDRKRGIPITLSIVTIEVARRAGVALVGVGLPGHFLVGDPADANRFVDPFSGGQVLDRTGCEQLFKRLNGSGAKFLDHYLDPVGPREIVARVLGNLKQVAAARGERRQLVRILRLRAAIPGVGGQERVGLADALVGAGHFVEAAAELEQLAERSRPTDADRLRQAAARARARLN